MPRHLTLLLMLALVVAAAGCGGGTSPSDSALPTATPTPADGAPPGILSSPEGTVLVKRAGSDPWTAAVPGMRVEEGDSLRTGANGTALLVFSEGSVMEIGAGSEIAIEELDISGDTPSTTVRLSQSIGNTINRVGKLTDPSSRYEVATPAGVVAVRGTVFGVLVAADGYTEVTCKEGLVSFTASGVTVVVEENMRSSASPGSAPSTPSPRATPSPGATPTSAAEPTPTASEQEPTPTAPPALFADANLEVAVREALGKPSGELLESDLAALTELTADSRDIADLSGLEYCTGLVRLYLRENQVQDLSPLSGLTGLTDLRLSGNGLSDISPLSHLIALTILDLNDNEITDITPLASLVNLQGLGLAGNHISDLSPLESGLDLGYLELQQNEISDIYPLVAAALGASSDCEDCYLNLTGNPLSPTSLSTYIPQLRQLGIEVVY